MNTRYRLARRAAVAGLLAGLGMVGQAAAEEPERLPLMKLPARAFRGSAADAPPVSSLPAVPSGPLPELVTSPPAASIKPLDGGLLPPATPPAAPASVCKDCSKPEDGKGGKAGDRFASVPPIAVFPRLGYFPITPTAPGYYSLLDVREGNVREAPPKHPHARSGAFPWSFFNVDWRYLDDPNNTEGDLWAFLKRQRFADDTCMITSGGELRGRYNYEVNSRLQNTGPYAGRDNEFDLFRARVYADLYVTEYFRLFAEFMSVVSPDQTFPPLPFDRNPADFLNLFAEAQVCTFDDKPVRLRVGRQELLYGSERLISPADWSNSRRTFQGGKLFWYSEKNDLDVFCVQPVLPNNGKFDSVDNNIVFAGVWYTHRPQAGEFIDAYYLMLDDANKAFTGTNDATGGRTVHTFGARWCGNRGNWLYDVEAMLQAGSNVNQGLFANAFTTGGGYHFKDCPMTPVLWLYYDHASGTPNPGEGTLDQTFSQLFPFGHYYFGFIDLVGRRNINDVSAFLTFWPDKWVFTQLQCHNFWLDSAKDSLYAAYGTPLRRDKTGAAGNYVGTEFDFLVNFHLDDHSDLLLSYSYLIAGGFIRETASTPGGKQDPQALYCQYTYRW
jgi:hypothetical protein